MEKQNWLKLLRESLKVGSQDKLAVKADLTPQTIRNYEAGRYLPTIANKAKLAAALGVAVYQIDEAIRVWQDKPTKE